jgi:hypothetical protein
VPLVPLVEAALHELAEGMVAVLPSSARPRRSPAENDALLAPAGG